MRKQADLSSPSFTCDWTYDVFLNFRGEDTRNNFTGNLYNSLHQRGIHTFIDDENLRRGEEIKPALIKAIQESRTAIMVFSENYAYSTYCLDELVTILDHLKAQGRLVWPIFYDVDPSDVRHQKGSYANALAKLEGRFQDDKGKVKKWREALYEAANLSGWHFFKQGSQPEYKFIKRIVDEVSRKLNHTPLHVSDNPVGLESRLLQVKSLLQLGSSEGVIMVGIYGVGGIGKSTIARALCNLIANQFDGFCFLADIREKAITSHGLTQLQETLLSKILGEKDIKIEDVNEGIPLIKWRLQRKKVLLILDNVDDLDQLKAIAGGCDWFGSGSRIIMTSRDKHLLATHGVTKFYEVQELNKKQALELLSWNAFKSNKVDPSYVNISNRVLSYAGGLPLALEVIGSFLYSKGIDEWNSLLDQYECVPNSKVDKILKVSYDGLEENEKNVFLDLACFFNNSHVSGAKRILHVRGLHPEIGIQILVDRSLIKIDDSDYVRMHDLIRDMGREIVRQESKTEPGERSRLWFDEDIIHVLQEDTGTNKIEVIMFSTHGVKEVHYNENAFKKIRNLKVLIFGTGAYLPHKWFDPLSFMYFGSCGFLRKVPDLSGLPNLRVLCVDYCSNLIEIHDSIGFLPKLILFSAQVCINLQTFGRAIWLPSLETLDLSWCTSLKSFPKVVGKMENIRHVYLDGTILLQELPFSIKNLIGLERLYMRRCKNLKLPSSIGSLPKLTTIYLDRGYVLVVPNEVREKVFFYF